MSFIKDGMWTFVVSCWLMNALLTIDNLLVLAVDIIIEWNKETMYYNDPTGPLSFL